LRAKHFLQTWACSCRFYTHMGFLLILWM